VQGGVFDDSMEGVGLGGSGGEDWPLDVSSLWADDVGGAVQGGPSQLEGGVRDGRRCHAYQQVVDTQPAPAATPVPMRRMRIKPPAPPSVPQHAQRSAFRLDLPSGAAPAPVGGPDSPGAGSTARIGRLPPAGKIKPNKAPFARLVLSSGSTPQRRHGIGKGRVTKRRTATTTTTTAAAAAATVRHPASPHSLASSSETTASEAASEATAAAAAVSSRRAPRRKALPQGGVEVQVEAAAESSIPPHGQCIPPVFDSAAFAAGMSAAAAAATASATPAAARVVGGGCAEMGEGAGEEEGEERRVVFQLPGQEGEVEGVFLFEKVLTQSDTGKLGRMVLPRAQGEGPWGIHHKSVWVWCLRGMPLVRRDGLGSWV
jgi:hypothetical protein